MKCSIVGCENEINSESEVEMSIMCCNAHVGEVVEYYKEQYALEQQEHYDDWLSSQ